MSLIDLDGFYRQLRDTLGVAIEMPIPARLGYKTANGRKVVKVTQGEDVGKLYFTTSAISDEDPGKAFNMGPLSLEQKYIRYGTPVYVARDQQDPSQYYIAGMRPQAAADFFGNQDVDAPLPVQLRQFIPGLVDETHPPSMKALVMGAPYRMDHRFRYHATQHTIDFTAEVPATAGRAKYVAPQLNFDTGALSYLYGVEFDATLSHEKVALLDAGNGTFMPRPDHRNYGCGYIKLIAGMTVVRRVSHIWAAQEIFYKADYTDILVADGDVVTADGEVVYA